MASRRAKRLTGDTPASPARGRRELSCHPRPRTRRQNPRPPSAHTPFSRHCGRSAHTPFSRNGGRVGDEGSPARPRSARGVRSRYNPTTRNRRHRTRNSYKTPTFAGGVSRIGMVCSAYRQILDHSDHLSLCPGNCLEAAPVRWAEIRPSERSHPQRRQLENLVNFDRLRLK
jgi:hypothetical protein